MLQAAQLSLFELADDKFTLLPYDTASQGAGAAEAAQRAVRDGAQLILGPLLAESVKAVTPVARAAGKNIVAFSNSHEVAGDGVFILGFVPRQQVETILDYAQKEGITRIAVLAPDDEYGRAVTEAARNAVGPAGLAKVSYYLPDASDFTLPVKTFAHYDERRQALLEQRKVLEDKDDEISRQALRRLEKLDTIGDPPFEAVLLPDTGRNLRTITSLLSFYDADRPAVQFLGLRQWDLVSGLSKEPALNGAWFVATPEPEREAFNTRFVKAFGERPPRLATLAYDATALAVVLAQGRNGPDFSVPALTDNVGFLGVDGIFRLRRDGVAERAFAVFEVSDTEIKVRRPAPETFEPTVN